MFVALSGENSPARRGGFLTPLQPQNISPYQFQVFFLKTGFSVVKALTEELAMIVSHTYLMCWNVFLFLHHGIGDRVSVSMPLKIRVFRVKYIELLIKGSPEKRRLLWWRASRKSVQQFKANHAPRMSCSSKSSTRWWAHPLPRPCRLLDSCCRRDTSSGA